WFGRIVGAPAFSPALALASAILAIGITAWVIREHVTAPKPAAPIANNSSVKQPAPQPVERAPEKLPPVQGTAQTQPEDVADNQFAAVPNEVSNTPKQRSGPREVGFVKRTNAKPSAEQLVREAEEKYIEAIDILSRDANEHRSQLTPEAL